ncbi:MAG: hypothetical protein J5855_07615 [Mailhella sp.]|nr:hypothetical protein [Mailhella sp.]
MKTMIPGADPDADALREIVAGNARKDLQQTAGTDSMPKSATTLKFNATLYGRILAVHTKPAIQGQRGKRVGNTPCTISF